MPNMGYTNPAASPRAGLGGGSMGAPHAVGAAPIQLAPDQPIGFGAAKPPPAQQAQHGGPRLPDFNKGMSEGAGGKAAAVGEAGAEVMAGGGPEDPVTDVLALGTLAKGLL